MSSTAVTGHEAEPEAERLDRNLTELLGELRVAVPGVQVLFAFLLVAPFNQRFEELTSFERGLYLVALAAAALATAFLMAPSAHHRMTFRLHDKPEILRVANRFVLAGLGFLAVAMVAAIWLVTSFAFSATTAAACTIPLALVFAVLWCLFPLQRRLRRQSG